jgi:hypothetical protein
MKAPSNKITPELEQLSKLTKNRHLPIERILAVNLHDDEEDASVVASSSNGFTRIESLESAYEQAPKLIEKMLSKYNKSIQEKINKLINKIKNKNDQNNN